MARGVARVSSGHLFNWEPTWPPELTPASAPSARSHPRGNASLATCTSVFRVTLILSLHPSKESMMDASESSIHRLFRFLKRGSLLGWDENIYIKGSSCAHWLKYLSLFSDA